MFQGTLKIYKIDPLLPHCTKNNNIWLSKFTTSQKNNKKKNVVHEEEEILMMISMDIYIVKKWGRRILGQNHDFFALFWTPPSQHKWSKNNRNHTHAKNVINHVYDISCTSNSAKKPQKGVIVLAKIQKHTFVINLETFFRASPSNFKWWWKKSWWCWL